MKAIILPIFILFSGCSQGPANITGTKWSCEKNGNAMTCNVKFTATNDSHMPADTLIRIRAHRRQSNNTGGVGAIQNVVAGDKVLKIILSPGEKRSFKETLISNGRVTNIVVTITSNEA